MGDPLMTDAERKSQAEKDEIDQLIADVHSPLPKIKRDTPLSGRVVESSK
jgi:hypothetical protein